MAPPVHVNPAVTSIDPVYPVSRFREWLQTSGLRFWCFITLCLMWAMYVVLFVRDFRYPAPKYQGAWDLPIQVFRVIWWVIVDMVREWGVFQLTSEVIEKYGWASTLWLVSVRLLALRFVRDALPSLWHFVVFDTPLMELNLAARTNPAPGYRDSVSPIRRPIHCICVRIVTKGNEAAQPMVKNGMKIAINLFARMTQCQYLKAHVVTETQFLDKTTKQQWVLLGATEVKEIVVPSNYVTPKGSLDKARCLCYWQETAGVGKECDEVASWILTLNEDAVITESLVASFVEDVITHTDEQKLGFASGLATFDTSTTKFTGKLLTARFLAFHYRHMMSYREKIDPNALFHGGAYFIRACTDRELGNDWGPKVSMADDYAIGLWAVNNRIGIRTLNGWFLEAPIPSVSAYISSMSRIYRGQIYATLSLPMTRRERLLQINRIVAGLLAPILHVVLVTCFLWKPSAFIPSGPRCTMLDLLTVLETGTRTVAYGFGAVHMRTSDLTAVVCLSWAPFMALIGGSLVDTVLAVWTFIGLIRELITGKVAREGKEKQKKKTR